MTDVYTFQITTFNDAGASEPSEIITRSFPSLPDIAAVELSLLHSLVKTADGINLRVIFNVRTRGKILKLLPYFGVKYDLRPDITFYSTAL